MVDARADETSPEEPLRPANMEAPHPGERIGRYEVLGKVGAGAMGAVYRARDPDLRREVAIKLVRPEHLGGRDAVGHRARLLSEARALAQLAHPNVVRVYDVGEQGDGVFLALEFIVGTDASQWLRDEQPAWPQILTAYCAAGRGLAAAHAAGLVHRDFKPTNILVGADHRVRVTDFGLATPRSELDPTAKNSVIVGTPAYMGPNQFAGEPADALSDQYAFFCSLWEALFGHGPFAASESMSLQQAKADDELQHPPIDTPVPAALVDILRKGLRADPRRRFADMNEALAELRVVARQQRATTSAPSGMVRWLPSVALGVAVVATVIAAALPMVGADVCGSTPVADGLRRSYSDAVLLGHRDTALGVAGTLSTHWDERGCEALAREWAALAAP